MCRAVPRLLLSVEGDDPLTRQGGVSFAGLVEQVNLVFVSEAKPGDYVLVHAGFAVTVIDEAEALTTLAFLAEFEPEGLS
ncbi:MAG: HypC/HybG/HupF family hydrogenase formation chaperone [Methylocella sp.]